MIQAIKLGMKPMIYTSEHHSLKNRIENKISKDAIKRKKPIVYSASLDNPIFKENDVILFYDTYDVLFFGDESHFKSSFHHLSAQFNKSVFVGGGLDVWPFQDKNYNCIFFSNFIFIYFYLFLFIFIYFSLFLFIFIYLFLFIFFHLYFIFFYY